MKNTKKGIIFIAGVLAIAMIAGALAFFSSTSSIKNDLSTKSYGGRTIEEFNPDQELEPGKSVTKTVGVTNAGDYDLVVRIAMNETWSRDGREIIKFDSINAKFNNVVRTGTDPDYKYDATQTNDTDGLTTGDSTVIYKDIDLTNWVKGGDGYWYYKDRLEPGQSTGFLLKSVTLADDTDLGAYKVTKYYSIAEKTAIDTAQGVYDTAIAAATTDEEKAAAAATLDAAYGWTAIPDNGLPQTFDQSTINYMKSESVLNDAAQGYSNADYALTVITEICQATKDAVEALWGTTGIPPAGTNWGLD